MRTAESLLRLSLSTLVRGYRYCISPLTPPCCRFYPSCSSYALLALRRFSLLPAVCLIVRRLFRCRPGGGYGYDPVPEKPAIPAVGNDSTHG